MASYYDRVLEDFDTRESEGFLDEGILDESSYDEGTYDEGNYDEALFNKRKRPMKVPSSLGKPANFGRNVPGSSGNGNLVTKAELKSSLNSISNQVNDLKKSSLTIASSIRRLDDGYEKVVKSIARKDRSQDNVMSSTTMMSLMGTLVNKPTLNTAALKIVPGTAEAGSTTVGPGTIELVQGQEPIQIDLMKTLMFTMMPTMINSNSANGDNSMMMLMMVLLLNKPAAGTANTNDNSMLMMVPMMMMMNKK